jgi:hypothetical protein
LKDILLAPDGDLRISDKGDITLTDSVRQAVRLRLLWFLGEWRFAPSFGMPYFEDILIKTPNIERVKQLVRNEAMTVVEVTDVRNVAVAVNSAERTAKISLDIVTSEEIYREELTINA